MLNSDSTTAGTKQPDKHGSSQDAQLIDHATEKANAVTEHTPVSERTLAG